MMLVEEGNVRLEDPITKYFPEAPQTWREITIQHLLTHTSGIQNDVAVPHWLDVFKTNLAFETAPTRDKLLKRPSSCLWSSSRARAGRTITPVTICSVLSLRRPAANPTGNSWTSGFSNRSA
jgi:hypothetical protein